ncbi:uncharacterized protein LOC123553177 [Mercenaria mercenaria]|uniref:uncharacterized protein LOC123553177 n=1 Tax=Mercenaria mercenaria TaxID=6596 RepID=UPI00234F24D7|nr:uncharacterized protein LOC123553177 [Mercenaria mercenaria]XP_045198857.2 uncharacterized protein LOC123553177 [Mercenaria mercenaria]
MSMYLRTRQDLGRKFENKKEVLPTVVQLGSTLPAKRAYENDIWTPFIPERKEISPRTESLHTVKCPKFKNLYEYNKKHNDKFNLKRNLWKIPSLGNNFLPFQKKSPHSSSEEVIGLYRPKFHRWYSRLVHENTVVLPPIETSERVKDDVPDSSKLSEKKYIVEQHKRTGPRERFTRDELYIPNVYSQCFTCRECQKQYANDVFNQTWQLRNASTPTCNTSNSSAKRAVLKRQHCDVLGERYCKSCIEKRNKNFSLQIEDKLLNSNDLDKVHYRSSFF